MTERVISVDDERIGRSGGAFDVEIKYRSSPTACRECLEYWRRAAR